MNLKQYSFLLATLFCQVLWTFGLIYASLNTIQSQAYVFNNIHGLFIVLITYFLGTHPYKKEWLGVFLAIIGCSFMIMDPKAARATEEAG
jgi:drug/metabolite transporter (DMT)-like permease